MNPPAKHPFLGNLATNPKRIFLMDACGALLSTILLFGVLAQFQPYFGMPKNALHVLSGLALCLSIYSFSCHLLIQTNWKAFLRILIIANILYSMLSLGFIAWFSEQLTELGWVYFIVELIVIGIIVLIEYRSYLNQVRS